MKTYVKIYGPPLLEALDALQKIALDMPNVTHYHLFSSYGDPILQERAHTISADTMPEEETPNILSEARVLRDEERRVTHPSISKSGHTLGEYDFFFEWREEPSWEQLRVLISKIDKALTPLNCKYTLINK